MNETYILSECGKALANFQCAAEQIVDPFKQIVEMCKPPQHIYHYTDDAGLKGIIESGKLRLSDIFSLNDPSELRHGLSFAADKLNSKAKNGPTEAKDFAKYFADFCQDGVLEHDDYFICSFSSDGNDLGQWRAYADNGRGYALGFDAEALIDIFKKEASVHGRCTRTFPVIYDDVELADIHQQIIESVFPRIRPYTNDLDINAISNLQIKNNLRTLLINLFLFTLDTALYFKHKAYENEKEFRFLQRFSNTTVPDVQKRSRSYELVKYREFDWRSSQPGVLKRVVVGPAADKPKATRFVKDCLKAFHPHPEDVETTSSKIPYRAV